MTRRLRDEAGYSLVEVMVSILLLSIAIIPMVAMFDTGLKSATTGGNYDTARTLANAKLEEVKALPYQKPGGASDSLMERYKPMNEPSSAGTAVSCDQPPFTCTVKTRYVTSDLNTAASGLQTSWIKIEVNVAWSGNAFTTSGLRVTR